MKSVLITGGTRGIGYETASYFNIIGWKVYVVARDFQRFNFEDADKVIKIKFDLTQVEKIPELASQVGPVDALINNAGAMFSLPYTDYPESKINHMLRLNLETPVALIREFSRLMISQGSGRIVNVSSLAAHTGHSDIWYGITKAGILNATKSFANLLGPKGIVVNAVAPGPTETEMIDSIPHKRKKDVLDKVYLGRFAKSVEVAKTILWLATECPEYVNGVCIDINNGFHHR